MPAYNSFRMRSFATITNPVGVSFRWIQGMSMKVSLFQFGVYAKATSITNIETARTAVVRKAIFIVPFTYPANVAIIDII